MTYITHSIETEKRWNNASFASRKRMLNAAGHHRNTFFTRVFSFIPKNIQDDLIYSYQCSAASASAFSKNRSHTQARSAA